MNTEERPTKHIGDVFLHLLSRKKKKKKKKKLVPSGSKKFGGDEKMPKSKNVPIMIAEEKYHGGFLNLDKSDDLNHGMQHPGLVARLMGLESMPIVHHKQPEKSSSALQFNSRRNETCEAKELRPQKRQKPVSPPTETLYSNRRARRQQHNKLSSLVKSPRLLSKKSTVQLIGQSRISRAKCTLTYADSSQCEEKVSEDAHMMEKSCNVSLNGSVVGPCRSFGRLNELPDSRLLDKDYSMEGYINVENKMKFHANRTSNLSGLAKVDAERSSMMPNSRNGKSFLGKQVEISRERRACDLYKRKNCATNDCKRKNQLTQVKERSVDNKQASRSESISFIGVKEVAAFNSGLNTCSRSRTKESGRGRVELERNGPVRRNIALKRRPNNSLQGENARAVEFSLQKNQNARDDLINDGGKRMLTKYSTDQNCVKTVSITQKEDNGGSCIEGSDVISFTFSSPMRRDSTPLKNKGVIEKRRFITKPNHDVSCPKNFVLYEKVEPQGVSSRGDTLKALLERKVEELSSLDIRELPVSGALSGISSDFILEELLSALQRRQQDSSWSDMTDTSDQTVSQAEMDKEHNKLEAKEGSGTSAYSVSGDHPSPFSILEASFSNDSCLSGSPYSRSGRKPYMGSSISCNAIQFHDTDAELLDSASSFDDGKVDTGRAPCHGVPECSLGYTSQAVSDAGLLLRSILPTEADGTLFLQDTTEAILRALDISEPMHRDQIWKLVFDCTIECIDTKYNKLFKSSGSELPLLVGREGLERELQDEIGGWNDLTGKAVHDVIERDLSNSCVWRRFATEACQIGVEIVNDMLGELVEEMVVDIWT